MSARLANYLQNVKASPTHGRRAHQADVAADLRVLISRSGLSYKQVAEAAGISAPALSKKLGGESNLTLDSIFSIAQAVRADFDIVFRPEGARRARQFWDSQDRELDGMLDLAMLLLDRSKHIHDEAVALKETWEHQIRSSFKRANEFSMASKYVTSLVCANDEAPDELLLANG